MITYEPVAKFFIVLFSRLTTPKYFVIFSATACVLLGLQSVPEQPTRNRTGSRSYSHPLSIEHDFANIASHSRRCYPFVSPTAQSVRAQFPGRTIPPSAPYARYRFVCVPALTTTVTTSRRLLLRLFLSFSRARILVPRHENGDAHLDSEVNLKQTWKAVRALTVLHVSMR